MLSTYTPLTDCTKSIVVLLLLLVICITTYILIWLDLTLLPDPIGVLTMWVLNSTCTIVGKILQTCTYMHGWQSSTERDIGSPKPLVPKMYKCQHSWCLCTCITRLCVIISSVIPRPSDHIWLAYTLSNNYSDSAQPRHSKSRVYKHCR